MYISKGSPKIGVPFYKDTSHVYIYIYIYIYVYVDLYMYVCIWAHPLYRSAAYGVPLNKDACYFVKYPYV